MDESDYCSDDSLEETDNGGHVKGPVPVPVPEMDDTSSNKGHDSDPRSDNSESRLSEHPLTDEQLDGNATEEMGTAVGHLGNEETGNPAEDNITEDYIIEDDMQDLGFQQNDVSDLGPDHAEAAESQETGRGEEEDDEDEDKTGEMTEEYATESDTKYSETEFYDYDSYALDAMRRTVAKKGGSGRSILLKGKEGGKAKQTKHGQQSKQENQSKTKHYVVGSKSSGKVSFNVEPELESKVIIINFYNNVFQTLVFLSTRSEHMPTQSVYPKM